MKTDARQLRARAEGAYSDFVDITEDLYGGDPLNSSTVLIRLGADAARIGEMATRYTDAQLRRQKIPDLGTHGEAAGSDHVVTVSAGRLAGYRVWNAVCSCGGWASDSYTDADTPVKAHARHVDSAFVLVPAPEPAADRPKVSKAATNHVFRNLRRETSLHHELGDKLETDSVENCRASGVRILRDQSELSSKTIEAADWVAIFEFYRSESEG